MEQKIRRKIFGSGKFSQFGRGYLSSTVNVLTNAPKISHITKRDILQISFPQSGEKI